MFSDEDKQGWHLGALASRPSGDRPTHPVLPSPDGFAGGSSVLLAPPDALVIARPLVVVLHGAGGVPRDIASILRQEAEARGILVWAPKSQRATWDVIANQFGPDVESIDGALARIFEHYWVDPARVAIAGFSDGASYALSLGLANGHLFDSVLAFSPGFIAPGLRSGKPRVYISHGQQDDVLPIERCSRRIVEQLNRAHYEVRYEEFTGGHVVPTERVEAALEMFFSGD